MREFAIARSLESASLVQMAVKGNRAIPSAAFFVLAALGIVLLHACSLDGIHGHLLSLVLKTDTEYSDGYSDTAFRKIRLGQTREEAIALLGQPLFKDTFESTSTERWVYSKSPSSTHYRYRELQITDGFVTKKVHYFYID